MDNVRKETHVVSVMNGPLETVAVVRDKKDDRPLPHQIRRPRLTAREKNPQKNQATEMKERIPRRYRNCDDPSCKCWHPPVCLNYKTKAGCTFGRKCFFSHVEADEKPSKKSKKGGAEGSVAFFKKSTQLGCVCVSQDSYPRKSFVREKEKLGSNRAVEFPKGT